MVIILAPIEFHYYFVTIGLESISRLVEIISLIIRENHEKFTFFWTVLKYCKKVKEEKASQFIFNIDSNIINNKISIMNHSTINTQTYGTVMKLVI